MSTDDLLNLDGLGQRQDRFEWHLLDRGLVDHGLIDVAGPPDSSAAVVSNDGSALIQRSLTGFELPISAAGQIDEGHALIQPWLFMEDGVGSPLGTFVFVDARRIRSMYGTGFEGTLSDLGIFVDRQSTETYGLSVGALIEREIAKILDQQGISSYLIDATGVQILTPIAWPAGRSWKQIVDELAGLMGCMPLFFEANGRGRVKAIPDPAIDAIDVAYASGLNIFDTGIADWNSLLTAPNFFKVIESGLGAADIVGTYSLPDSAPNSEFALGQRIAEVSNEQGMGSTALANQLARLRAITHGTVVSNVAFDGPADWRHGTYSVLEVLGERYLERKWSLACEVGAPMHHECSKVFA